MPILSKVEDATDIPDAADRAITWTQLTSFARTVDRECKDGQIIDGSAIKANPKGKKVANTNQKKPLRYNIWDGDEKNMTDFFAEINMHEVVDSILKPMTEGPCESGEFPSGCSYVELVADSKQPPQLFIAHHWGQAFSMFISILKAYLKRRSQRAEVGLWIASLAHRPWCTDVEIGSNLDICPAAKVINHPLTQGTVLVTSQDCVALQRLWCLFEISKGMQKRRGDFEIAIGDKKGEEVQILCTSDESRSDVNIPDALWDKLLDIDVEGASASKFADKHMIMSKVRMSGVHHFSTSIKKQIGQQVLTRKVLNGDIDSVKDLLSLSVNVNRCDPASKVGTALHIAVAASNVAIAKLLIKGKADVNNQNNAARQSPLHKATTSQMLQLLLDSGADADLEDAVGRRGPQIQPEAEKPPAIEEPRPAAKDESEALAVPDTKPETNAPDATDQLYDVLLSLIAAEQPVSTKVPMKFPGSIRLPRQATLQPISG